MDKIGYLQECCNRFGDFKVAARDSEGMWSKHKSMMELWESEDANRLFLLRATDRTSFQTEIRIDLDPLKFENDKIKDEKFVPIKRVRFVLQKMEELKLCNKHAKVFFSGSKGFHIHTICPILKGMTRYNRERYRKYVLRKLNADEQLASESHMLSLEYSNNPKTGNNKIELSDNDIKNFDRKSLFLKSRKIGKETKEQEAKMAWNLDGNKPEKEYERTYLEELKKGVPQVYEGEITTISDIYEQKKLGSDAVEDRITINVKIKNGKEIPFFANWKVSKGSGSYSNSKLYDVIGTAGLLEEAKDVAEKESNEQLKWLKDNLVGKKVKFLPKTVRKDDKENRYSVVDKFTDVEGEIGEEQVSSSSDDDDLEESVEQNKKDLAAIRQKMADMKRFRDENLITQDGFEKAMRQLKEQELMRL